MEGKEIMKEKVKANIQDQQFRIHLKMRSVDAAQVADALVAYLPSGLLREEEGGAYSVIDHLERTWLIEMLPEAPREASVSLYTPLLAYEEADEFVYLVKELRERGAQGGEGCGMRFFAAVDGHAPQVSLNLEGILISKASLLEKVLGGKVAARLAGLAGNEEMIEALPSPVATDLDPDEIKSCIQLGCAIAAQSANQARVSAFVVPYENERYAFRCWMTRMGMNGDEYKASRKRFLSRLEGDCSFKGGRKPVKQKAS